MSLDPSAMGVLVASLMESIADEHDGEDVSLGTIAVVVEINGPDWTTLRYRCSDPRHWVQAGFLRAAQHAIDPMLDDES